MAVNQPLLFVVMTPEVQFPTLAPVQFNVAFPMVNAVIESESPKPPPETLAFCPVSTAGGENHKAPVSVNVAVAVVDAPFAVTLLGPADPFGAVNLHENALWVVKHTDGYVETFAPSKVIVINDASTGEPKLEPVTVTFVPLGPVVGAIEIAANGWMPEELTIGEAGWDWDWPTIDPTPAMSNETTAIASAHLGQAIEEPGKELRCSGSCGATEAASVGSPKRFR